MPIFVGSAPSASCRETSALARRFDRYGVRSSLVCSSAIFSVRAGVKGIGMMITHLRLTWLFNLHRKFIALRRLLGQHGVTWALVFLAQRFVVRWFIPLFEVRARKKIEAWTIEQRGRIH